MPPKVIDLVGQRFGKLTVVAQDNTFDGKGTRWVCDCDCGSKGIMVRRAMLIRGKTKSCGCYKREYLESVFKDLSGQRFGKLIVRERFDKKGKTYWLCDCDCGTTGVVASSSDLKNGDKASCGCDCGNTDIEVVRSSLVAKDSHKQVSCGCWVKEGNHSVSRYSDRKAAIVKTLYTKLKIRNKKLGFGDDIITISDFTALIEQPCSYCGLTKSDTSKEPRSYRAELTGTVSHHIDLDYVYHHNGIDRIDSNRGYTPDNVLPCCKYCNVAKLNNSQEDFLEWAERVYCHFVVGED